MPADHTNYIWAYQISTNLQDWSYSEPRPDAPDFHLFHYEEIPVWPKQDGDICFYRVEWSLW
jgi:hypothetical protein